ncbi:M13 family metallopeptidase [Aquimonas sp.]|uniref:M13 family metallopeptidase n=1 Tax=Aquimonas sp. TaxID=1872588 RepID=UPI0037C0048D
MKSPLRTLLSLAVLTGLAACSAPSNDTAAPAAPVAETAAAAAPAPKPIAIDMATIMTQPISFKATELNPDVAACTDLNLHTNAVWLAANPVPSDRSSWGSFEVLGERSLEVQHAIVKAAAASNASAGSIEQKVGDFFGSGMDEAAIEAAGINPLKPRLAQIDAITDTAGIADFLRASYARGQGQLFGFYANADLKNSEMVIGFTGQGGLSLPERSYYLEDRADFVSAREGLLKYAATLLQLAGADEASARSQADQILAFETRLAKASMDRVSLRDPASRYNPVSIAEADAITPNFPWGSFFDAVGVAQPTMFSLGMPDFFREFNAMLTEVPVAEWQTWLRFRTISNAAPYMGKAFDDANFELFGRTLRGQQEQQERWKRVLNAVNASMGEALGQLYVAVAFPPDSKAKMEQLVDNLRESLKERLNQLDWMGEDTKARALEKWASFTPKIGYPDKWREWDGLQVGRNSYVDNLEAAAAFNYRFMLDKIGKPVDKTEWGMSPQTVNAYYRASANEIVFPAAILQPPFFDPNADDGLNYGGIGAVIGHEMLHGYDDQGSKFDAVGNFANWWSDQDRERFNARTDKLVSQFNAYEALPGLNVNGALALGENIADLGGLTVAYAAMRRAQGEGFTDPNLEGLTQSQRFFLNWATVWRRGFTEEAMKLQITNGPHAPGLFRAIGAPSNMPAFHEAFNCQPGDRMRREGEQRVAIW